MTTPTEVYVVGGVVAYKTRHQAECAALAGADLTGDAGEQTIVRYVRDYHADMCALLHLDPERATPDDVLALVGGLLDAAGRLDRLRAALAEVANASPCALSQTVAAMRALREDGEATPPPSPWRPVSEEPEESPEAAYGHCLVDDGYAVPVVAHYSAGAWRTKGNTPITWTPTHWMPIPPLPVKP